MANVKMSEIEVEEKLKELGKEIETLENTRKDLSQQITNAVSPFREKIKELVRKQNELEKEEGTIRAPLDSKLTTIERTLATKESDFRKYKYMKGSVFWEGKVPKTPTDFIAWLQYSNANPWKRAFYESNPGTPITVLPKVKDVLILGVRLRSWGDENIYIAINKEKVVGLLRVSKHYGHVNSEACIGDKTINYNFSPLNNWVKDLKEHLNMATAKPPEPKTEWEKFASKHGL